jgi:hypothetical protein
LVQHIHPEMEYHDGVNRWKMPKVSPAGKSFLFRVEPGFSPANGGPSSGALAPEVRSKVTQPLKPPRVRARIAGLELPD